ncbi:selenocysteine lyase/cysteine desulfurase [Rhizobium leguminosarum]|uniref:Selenocysteine lyase/cysteine desulfurase n=1 Tax=Rhizobium leguminosarum TaxID=384 RepID=A0AAE2MMR3_RHILE|nr:MULTISPECIES: aminotransferase class V-fold PLP-dependent enzyme [Rhizobium]MBB4292373.1 selenocysteine lyase/cysteine desulfurase [Rhizobium leguminosarum]MBB4298611.1 selenocysteine lyase/cysteine desulfurase [Rhizobium leguminosarum]MBB4310415.1 selenocysteine lyase/cysteine desulfurase [Rhizobium leguminosarum]MBB4434677.1 selenocysteine lyase/cysteine desulfurase [Rhizobium esperanzae]MBB4531573.1 selenocysteine lyase/cysteine desulfurase [Rhizobium leguminosarum]
MTEIPQTELDRLRQETPGVQNRIHLNNAGAALVPRPVFDTVVEYLERENSIGGYEAHAENIARIEGVHDSIARLVGAGREEISLAENATLAWQRAFYSLHFKPGERILTTTTEFAANYVAYLQVSQRTGARVEVIPDDASGALDPEALERMIDGSVRLISITWIPSNGGLVNPAAEVGKIARRNGITYLLDACQAVGQMPIDVAELGCDLLTATGRKFLRAPRGTGFLYVRRDLLRDLEPAFIDLFGAPWVGPERYQLRNDARRFETWEANYSTRLGLGAAADYAMDIGLERIRSRCSVLAGQIREGLGDIPGVRVRDIGRDQASIVSFTMDGKDARKEMKRLTDKGINISVSPPSTTPLDASHRGLPDILRVSPHYYNDASEISQFLDAVRESSG